MPDLNLNAALQPTHAEAEGAVAWLVKHPVHGHIFTEHAITDGDRSLGWVDVPLYTSPTPPPIEGDTTDFAFFRGRIHGAREKIDLRFRAVSSRYPLLPDDAEHFDELDALLADVEGEGRKIATTIEALRAERDEWREHVQKQNANVAHNLSRAEQAEAQVSTLTRQIEEAREALREISSPTQAEGLLWWQLRAREALGGPLCPRPANHQPDGLSAEACIAAGECGCVHGNAGRSALEASNG